jgi:hypothetical protein
MVIEPIGDAFIPKGYIELKDIRVYTNGKNVVLTGDPTSEDDPEAEIHDCDFMGCRWEHVLSILKPMNRNVGKWLKFIHEKEGKNGKTE